MSVSVRTILALVAGALLWAGCAKEQPPVNRVQPDYYDKAFFIGQDFTDASDDPEFYSRGSLVDVGYGAGQDGLFTSTYAQPLSRVKWTITEDWLIARLAYERVANSDGKGLGRATNDGIVVAAYPITRHFDVQRSYNPSTGEQLNVIEENTTDRPWYERQYIRVDWSQNHSTDNYDFDTLSQIGIFGGVQYEPISYYVNDPASDDAPHYAPEDGYLDITNKAWARPQLVDISSLGWGLGVVPACWFNADFMGGPAPAGQCNPVELTIRQSFVRVDKKTRDYEPEDWDGYRFQAFGAFTTDRYGYARNYGMSDNLWHRFIDRYNLWERSHRYADPEHMTGEIACFTPETTPVGANPHRDMDGNGTEDECELAGSGSRCDEFKQRCTLPYRERTPVTIAWYFANGSDQEYFQPTADAAHEWDVALRGSVMTARYAECMRTGGTDCGTQYPVYNGGQEENDDAVALAKEVDDCRHGLSHVGEDCQALAETIGQARGDSRGVIELAKLPEMLVLCHSPVEAADPAVCAREDQRLPRDLSAAGCNAAYAADTDKALIATCRRALNVRPGDLRYHQVNAIPSPQTPSPWGIMVDADDPLTGEKVEASINVWTFVNDLWSQSIVDTARYIKGELSTSDVTDGTYVKDWAQAAASASKQGALPLLTRAEIKAKVAQFTGAKVDQLPQSRLEERKAIPADVLAKVKELERGLEDVRADARAPSMMEPIYEARRQRAVGTPTEAALTTPMMQSFAGVDGKLPSSEAMMQFASPLRGANPSLQVDLQRRHELALADRGACVMNEAPAPFAVADLADLLEKKFGKFDPSQSKVEQAIRAEKMRRYLAHRAHYAVITHEMGHSVGLRHNFVSSSDAFNYRPQYWQLRTDNGENTTECTDLTPDGSCVGPRYFDPITPNERENLITMFMQSSTMDYAGESLQDMMGLGAYDFAAARMFYGDVAAVFADGVFDTGTPRGTGVLEKMDNFGGILGFRPTIGTEGAPLNTHPIHYSQLQKNYNLINNCHEVDPAAFKPGDWDTDLKGLWDPTLDGLIVQVNGKYSRCHSQPVDYVQWAALRDPTASDVGSPRAGHAIDPSGRVRFPYGFATDRWADLGNLSVYRHDNGADAYELFDFLITQQEVNHIFDNYRRNRQTFSVRGASMRTLQRYNTKIRDGAKGLGLISNIYKDFALSEGYDFKGLWPFIADYYFGDNILASNIAFDHFARQMARPQSGPHFVADANGMENQKVLRSSTDSAGNPRDTALVVPNGATGVFRNVAPGGRPLENALSDNHGEYDSEYTINCGSYYDKAWSTMLMTESVDNFISASRRDFLDARYRSVSLADLYPDAYRRWLANNLTGDELIKGTRVALNEQNQLDVDQSLYPNGGIGWTSWSGGAPKACFVGESNIQCSDNPANTMVLESQVGWEQQKFLIAWTLQYLPENQQQWWLNQLDVWELGADSDPGFPNRIEYHSPTGKTFIARTSGKEQLFGETVQKGVSARVLEYANQLLARAYDTAPGPDLDGDGQPDWYTLKIGADGQPHVKYDPSIAAILDNGQISPNGRPGCDRNDNSQCTCSANRACVELERYEEVPFFLRQAMRDYGLADPSMKGVY